MSNFVTDATLMYKTNTDEDPNKKTIASYNEYAQDYIKKTTPTVDESPAEMREWIDTALSNVPKDGSIFEIGSAITRDAKYMRSKGYNVTCSDAAKSFVRIMRESGEPAAYFNILEDKLLKKYDMFYANGVFPHFTVTEVRQAIRNVRSSLKPHGIIAFSVKQGTGEEWITEKLQGYRFAHYWTEDDIKALLNEEHFKIIYTSFNTGLYPSHRWYNIIAKKED